MGSDNLFHKRKKTRKRKVGIRTPSANSFLIVTEGKATEVNYFNSIKTLIEEKIGGNVDIHDIPKIDVSGEGTSTMSLIKITDKIINKSKIIYENIWIVFDKDDFDEVIEFAKSKGYEVAWSNQCFEYWLLLHLNYIDSGLHRKVLFSKLNEIFKVNWLHKYDKSDKDIFRKVSINNGVETAIHNAKKRMKNYDMHSTKASQYAPVSNI